MGIVSNRPGRWALPTALVFALVATPIQVAGVGPPRPPASSISFGSSILQLMMVTPATGWAFSTRGVARTTDGGHTWRLVNPSNLPQEQPVPCGRYPGALGLSANAPDRAWFAISCDTSQGLATQLTLWRTTTSGRKWSSTILQGHGIEAPNDIALDFVGPNTGWLAPESVTEGVSLSGLFETHDGGAHWKSIFSSDTAGNLLGFATRTLGYGFSEPDYPGASDFASFPYVTTNGGAWWNHRKVPIPAGYKWAAVAVGTAGFSGSRSVAIPVTMFHTSPFGGSLSTTYRTNDGGVHWWHTAFIDGGGSYFFNATDGWVDKNGRTLLRTTDGGWSWSVVTTHLEAHIGDYAFVTPRVGFSIGSDLSGRHAGILSTTNAGRTWNFISPLLVR